MEKNKKQSTDMKRTNDTMEDELVKLRKVAPYLWLCKG